MQRDDDGERDDCVLPCETIEIEFSWRKTDQTKKAILKQFKISEEIPGKHLFITRCNIANDNLCVIRVFEFYVGMCIIF